MLQDLDDHCNKNRSLALRIFEMERFLWNPKYIYMEEVIGYDPSSPMIEYLVAQDKRLTQIDKPFIAYDNNSNIVVTFHDMLPDGNFPKSIWIIFFDVLEFSMNYSHPIEFRTVNPTSAWITFYPIKHQDQLQKKVDGSNEQVTYTFNVSDILTLHEQDGSPILHRSKLWSLFVVGKNIETMTYPIPTDNQKILLERNITTVIIFQTLIESTSVDCKLKEALSRAIQMSDRKHFKISKNNFNSILDIIKPYMNHSNLAEFGFEIRRFDGKPWFTEAYPHESNRLHVMIRPTICYRKAIPTDDEDQTSEKK